MLGLRGVNGFACGFKVNFLPAADDGFSFDDDETDVGVESDEIELPTPELLMLLFTLFTL